MSANPATKKAIHEAFAKFFETPTRGALRSLLRENVGEFNHLDFKEAWLPGPKLARHILGFANSEGGVIVVGLKELADSSLSADGIESFTDKTDLHLSFKKFVPDELKPDILDFQFNETEYAPIKGKKFQVLIVNDEPEKLPWISTSDGDGIDVGTVYVRDGVSTTKATHSQLQKLLNRRIATGHSTTRELTLKEHLEELKLLFAEIKLWLPSPSIGAIAKLADSFLGERNPRYPKEGYESFIARAIEEKKQVIMKLLTVRPRRE